MKRVTAAAMSDDTTKRFCVVDHAGKGNDRRRRNPNRRARDEEAERWLKALQRLLAEDDGAASPAKRR